MRYALLLVTVSVLCGCAGRSSMMPNPDKSLRRTSAEFAADAAKRHPYKADAPRGGEAVARAEFDYTFDWIKIVNLSPDEMDDVELWVNQDYVVLLPKMEPNIMKKIDFQMLFDDKGSSFPTDNKKALIKKVEIYRGGKMYNVNTHPVD